MALILAGIIFLALIILLLLFLRIGKIIMIILYL